MKVQHLKTNKDVSRVKSWYKPEYNQKVCGAKLMGRMTAKDKAKKSEETMSASMRG